MKVLVSAYACEPEKGSEPGVGWNAVCQAARLYQVWVLTREKNRRPIEAALRDRPMPNVHWVYYDPPGLPDQKKSGTRLFYPHHRYYLWQLGAYFVARKLHRGVGFDLIHHVTFVNYWLPSFLPMLPVPFLWGPVGGAESAPPTFWRSYSLRGRAYEAMRAFGRGVSELNPLLRRMARRTRLGLATTEQTAARLRFLGCRNVLLMSQAGLTEDEILRLGSFSIRDDAPFRVVSIGNLLHLKGFELGLRAFATFSRQNPTSEYWIVGDGPERKRLERLARDLSVSDRVAFKGAIPRGEAFAKLAECDLLLHPALHESGGLVTLEAMAAGRPVICFDLGGVALQVTPETGIKVPALSPEQAVRDLAVALGRLASDPGLRARMAQAARQRVREQFNWEIKGERLAAIYAEVVGKQPEVVPQMGCV